MLTLLEGQRSMAATPSPNRDGADGNWGGDHSTMGSGGAGESVSTSSRFAIKAAPVTPSIAA
jgi:hypothetical protein